LFPEFIVRQILKKKKVWVSSEITLANDLFGRQDVTLQMVFLQSPDDGLGALPQHIIVNNSKSSIYKLALHWVRNRKGSDHSKVINKPQKSRQIQS
jgi:hypothetical protein